VALVYFEISFSDEYWSKKASVSINLSVFVVIILSESSELDILTVVLGPDMAFGRRQPKTVQLLESQNDGKNRPQLFHLFMPMKTH
jgi:hypothetical protein